MLVAGLTIQIGYGQACGIYRIKYTAFIQSNNNAEVVQVKLPSISFLHGYEKTGSERAFIVSDVVKNKIEVEIRSPLTSYLSNDASIYLELYREKNEALPIILIVLKENIRQELTITLSWDQIEMKKIEDDRFGNLFELNLNEIKVE